MTVRCKVAHLTSVHAPADTRIAYRECATLADAGYDVVLVAPGTAPGLPRGVRFVGVPAPRNRLERMTRTIWCVYRAALSERASVYHFHDPELMGVGLALRMRGARVIFDVHEDIPSDIVDKPWIPSFLRRPVAIAAHLVLRLFHRRYSAIVAATPSIARSYPHPRNVLVANYPKLEELELVQPPPFVERSRSVLYVGEITRLRGAREMVAALAALPTSVRLTLIGTFEDAALEREVRALAGWRHVDYLGRRSRAELAALLAGARAGMLLMLPAANHVEALPTKIFEYMAAGLPAIVSTAVPRSAAIVRAHECGMIVDPSDVRAVADAIVYCVEHPDEAQRMGERGRRAAEEHYQWGTQARKLEALYAAIA